MKNFFGLNFEGIDKKGKKIKNWKWYHTLIRLLVVLIFIGGGLTMLYISLVYGWLLLKMFWAVFGV